MHSLTALIQTMPEYRKLRQAVLSGSRALSFYGLSPVHRATFAAALDEARAGGVAVLFLPCHVEPQGLWAAGSVLSPGPIPGH